MEKVKSIETVIAKLKREFPFVQREYGVESLSVFGSYSRGEQQENSDLDLLVTFNKTPGFFQYVRLENYLSEILGIKVDLVMKGALKNRVSEAIDKDIVSVT